MLLNILAIRWVLFIQLIVMFSVVTHQADPTGWALILVDSSAGFKLEAGQSALSRSRSSRKIDGNDSETSAAARSVSTTEQH